MTFIALDDEPLALVVIQKYAQELPQWKLLATFTDVGEAAGYLKQNTVDLLMTDINMPDVSGLQFVRDLPDERPMVIFITAYKEHAHEGFDLNVVDYLVKPVSRERFEKALNKAADLLELRRKAETTPSLPQIEDHFFVFSEYQQVKIPVNSILYMEGMGDYVKIFLEARPRPVITLNRLKHFAASLHGKEFRRIHRSYLVNMRKVEAWQKSRVLVGGVWLHVGETYTDVIDELMRKTS